MVALQDQRTALDSASTSERRFERFQPDVAVRRTGRSRCSTMVTSLPPRPLRSIRTTARAIVLAQGVDGLASSPSPSTLRLDRVGCRAGSRARQMGYETASTRRARCYLTPVDRPDGDCRDHRDGETMELKIGGRRAAAGSRSRSRGGGPRHDSVLRLYGCRRRVRVSTATWHPRERPRRARLRYETAVPQRP